MTENCSDMHLGRQNCSASTRHCLLVVVHPRLKPGVKHSSAPTAHKSQVSFSPFRLKSDQSRPAFPSSKMPAPRLGDGRATGRLLASCAGAGRKPAPRLGYGRATGREMGVRLDGRWARGVVGARLRVAAWMSCEALNPCDGAGETPAPRPGYGRGGMHADILRRCGLRARSTTGRQARLAPSVELFHNLFYSTALRAT